MPALERLLAAAGRIMPLPIEEAGAQLARMLGEGHGLGAAMRFADAVGIDATVRRTEAKSMTSGSYAPREQRLRNA